MKHTQGKWQVQHDGNWTVVSGDFTICHDNTEDHERRPEESFANAERIVTCVNNHDELLAVCKVALERLQINNCEGSEREFIGQLEEIILKVEGRE